jgi:hypothetical protein
MSLSFTLALTVADGSAVVDVLVRGNAEQTVGELARRLAAYLGLAMNDPSGNPLAYGLRVERTGEQLRPEAPLTSVDLLEGDLVTVLPPRGAARRRPRWAEAESETTIIPLRPR